MFEPRVVYACNHYITESYNEAVTLNVSKGESIDNNELYCRKDMLIPNPLFNKEGVITVNSAEVAEALGEEDGILSFSVNCKTFYQGEHFELGYEMRNSPDNKFSQYVYIKWLNQYKDVLPDLYSVNMKYTRTISDLYDERKCPRCNGDGWYTGIFEHGNINPSKVKNKDKLVQCFLKYIYTRKQEDGYGTRMLEIPGKYDLADSEFINILVRDEIMSFKKYYTDKTSAMILDGYNLSDGEILKAMSVSDIEIDSEALNISVVVQFITADGDRSAVNLMIAEL